MKNSEEFTNLEKELLESMGEALVFSQGKNPKAAKLKRVRREKFVQVLSLTGDDVIAIRKKLNLSQPRLADFLDVDVSTIRRWEQNNQIIKGPSARLLQALLLKGQDILQVFLVS